MRLPTIDYGRMKIDVLTLFPAMFAGPLDESIIKRAREAGVAGSENPQPARLDA